ncbi:L-histidine N(alpha)-methyltransferase [Nocardia speluncae]|uniref:L-histidine N(alpha)-methyltransferase n=1 Tax=Nocardia speluncae TaxID=419477 RepID=UPI001B34EC8A
MRAGRGHRVAIDGFGTTVEPAAGSVIHIETVATFGHEKVESAFTAAGLEIDRMWTDSRGDYALVLVRPPG